MSGKAPGKEQLNKIAGQAEQDLNTYQAKTGGGRTAGLDDYGVNSRVEKKFPGSDVKVGDDLITNASYDRKIPESEGGDVDSKGRIARGSAYEGAGGPENKPSHVYQHPLNRVEETVVRQWGQDVREGERATLRRGDRPDLLPSEEAIGGRGRESLNKGELAEQGRAAAKANVGLGSSSHGDVPKQGSGSGSQFKGEYYETPESVPDQRADQNEVPPESAVKTSRNI